MMIRRDIQCLRGIAIALVLLYHLFPSLFTNGFLGVDIFFVLSGYLMACNLTRTGLWKFRDFGNFYFRRFRRILPLYYLVILFSVIFFHVYLGEFYWETNRRYSLAALFVRTNQQAIEDNQDYFKQVLKSKYLAYLGDISYTVYLVHWPIICLFSGSGTSSYVFCIVSIFLVSIFVHHFYEKVYLKLDKPAVLSLMVLLVLSNTFLQYSIRNHDFWKQRLPPALQNIVDDNMASDHTWDYWVPERYFSEPCLHVTDIDHLYENKRIFGNCRFNSANGSHSVLLAGNSYSMNMLESIKTHFDGNYSDFQYTGLPYNYLLYSDSEASQLALKAARMTVEKMKPDILFIVSRFSPIMFSGIEENDDIVKQMNENLKFYQKYAQKIYILGPHPVYENWFLSHFLHVLNRRPDEIEHFHLDKIKTDNSLRSAFKRFKAIDCPKCHVFDLSRPFIENDKYLTFDRETLLSYVDNSVHFTIPGLKFLEPVFKKMVNELMATF